MKWDISKFQFSFLNISKVYNIGYIFQIIAIPSSDWVNQAIPELPFGIAIPEGSSVSLSGGMFDVCVSVKNMSQVRVQFCEELALILFFFMMVHNWCTLQFFEVFFELLRKYLWKPQKASILKTFLIVELWLKTNQSSNLIKHQNLQKMI